MLIRKLGSNEQGMEWANRVANSMTIVTYSKIRGPLTPDWVRAGLAKAAERYPLLVARIVRHRGQLYFATSEEPTIPLETARLVSETDWQAAYQAALNRPLDSNRGLSRAQLLETPDPQLHYLLITTHHAISDGVSCDSIHAELLNACNRLAAQSLHPLHPLHRKEIVAPPLCLAPYCEVRPVEAEKMEELEEQAAQPPLPSIERMLPPAFRGYLGWKKSAELLLTLVGNLRRLKLDSLPVTAARVQDRKTRLIQRRLTPAQMIALTAACTLQRTTTNAVFSAAMLIAVARQLRRPGAQKATLTAQIVIDLRRYLQPFSSAFKPLKTARLGRSWLMNGSGTVMHSYAVGATDSVWELAGEIKRRLRQSIRDREMLSYVRLRQLLLRFTLWRSHRSNLSISTSSVGEVDLNLNAYPGKTLFTLEDYSGAASMNLYTGTFALIASQLKGELTLNFLFAEPTLDESTMQALVRDTMEQLESLVAPPEHSLATAVSRVPLETQERVPQELPL